MTMRFVLLLAVLLVGCAPMQKTRLAEAPVGGDRVHARSLVVVDLTVPYASHPWLVPGWRRVHEGMFESTPGSVLKGILERSVEPSAAAKDIEVSLVELAFFEEVPGAVLVPLMNLAWEHMARGFKCQLQFAVKQDRRADRYTVEHMIPFTSAGVQAGESFHKMAALGCWPGLVSKTIRKIDEFSRSD